MQHSMKKIISMGLMIFFSFTAAPAHASWLIYHKPEFKGKVNDAETKAPIEGAAVSVYYEVHYYDPGGGGSRVIHTKETLTDENGEFVIPSYTTLMLPFNTSDDAYFIIYKPGYGNFPGWFDSCVKGQEFFPSGKYGLTEKCLDTNEPFMFTYGFVELPRLSTKYERLRAIPGSHPSRIGAEEFPLLYKLINEERRRFGLGEVNH